MRYLYVSDDLRFWVTSEEATIDGRCALAKVVTQVDADDVRRRYRRCDAEVWRHLRRVHGDLPNIRARLVELYGEPGIAAAERIESQSTAA